MYCSKCGKQISEEDKFCPNCGKKINDSNSNSIKNKQINLNKNNNKKNLIIVLTIGIFLILGASIMYFKYITHSQNINISKSEYIASQNNIDSDILTSSEKISESVKETNKEKEVFAQLLKSPKWFNENIDYKESINDIEFTVLDINQDGVYEMLLYHGKSHSLAGLTLTIVSYNVNEDKINIQKINVSHGGYIGYLSNEKTIVTSAMFFGVSYMTGYKLEGDRYIETFFTSDNINGVGSDTKIIYTLNKNNVSKEEYDTFIEPIRNNLTYTEMYSINDENIKNVLGIDSNILEKEDFADRYSTLKFSTTEEAREWLLKQDGNFISKKNLIIEESNDNEIINSFFQFYVLEDDDYFLFEAKYFQDDISQPMIYLVGKHSGNVYLIGTQGEQYSYLIKNNEVIEKLKYNNEESSDWRELIS